jgi:hypothetical protein
VQNIATPCQKGMAHSRFADGGDDLQTRKLDANTMRVVRGD